MVVGRVELTFSSRVALFVEIHGGENLRERGEKLGYVFHHLLPPPDTAALISGSLDRLATFRTGRTLGSPDHAD